VDCKQHYEGDLRPGVASRCEANPCPEDARKSKKRERGLWTGGFVPSSSDAADDDLRRRATPLGLMGRRRPHTEQLVAAQGQRRRGPRLLLLLCVVGGRSGQSLSRVLHDGREASG
jgi:hypothetical protein